MVNMLRSTFNKSSYLDNISATLGVHTTALGQAIYMATDKASLSSSLDAPESIASCELTSMQVLHFNAQPRARAINAFSFTVRAPFANT